MTKIKCYLAALLCIAVLAIPTYAANKNQGRVYVIQKGDTLWGLSERFITDPYYWPNLWANNPFIRNPHLIYPGQKVRVRDGRLEILPADWEPGQDGATPGDPSSLPPLPDPIEQYRVKTYPGVEGFIATEDFGYGGLIVDFEDSRLVAAEGDIAFAQFSNLDEVYEGDEFRIYRIGPEVMHPITGEPFGKVIEELGSVKVDTVDLEVATLNITRTQREIERGDVLNPPLPYEKVINLKRASKELKGFIVAGRDTKFAQGQQDLIYIDLGASDGLAVGNVLDISRPRVVSEYALKNKKQPFVLPQRLLGAAVVVDVSKNSAVALIVKSVDTIETGDHVQTVMP